MRKIVLSVFAILMLCFSLTAQNQRVTGTVTGADGAPIDGAVVTLKGSRVSAVTTNGGKYSIDAPADGVLVFEHGSKQQREENISGRTVINVQMQDIVHAIEAVVITGYGNTRREAFTGSAVAMTDTDISKRTSTSVVNSLAGQLPGVQIRSSDGSPGSEAAMRIRGGSSLYAGNDPLVILDGTPYEGGLSSINSNDIESVTVLKDAASTALYGARGANGVVQVTTKRGRRNEATINFDAKVGVGSRMQKDYDLIRDPALHYETIYRALYNNNFYRLGQSPSEAHRAANASIETVTGYIVYDTGGQELIGTDGKINPNSTLGRSISSSTGTWYLTPDDWIDAAYKNSIRQEYNLNISGGSDRSTFFASVGYLNEDGIVAKSNFERFTARLASDYQAKKWLKVGASMYYTNTSSSYSAATDDGAASSGNIFAFTYQIAPIYPLYLRDGSGNIMQDEWGWNMYDYGDGSVLRRPSGTPMTRPLLPGANPLQQIQLDDENTVSNAFFLYGFADIFILPELKFTINGTNYIRESRLHEFTNPYYGQYAINNGMITVQHSKFHSMNTQQMLTYNKQFGEHSISAVAVHEFLHERTYYVYGSKKIMYADNVFELNAAIDNVGAGSASDEYLTEGYLLRAQYDYQSKYFFNGSFRYDSSSRFSPDDRWGSFWSLGGAWLMHKEDFMSSTQSWLDELKLKVSYGEVGNDQIGNYGYTNTFVVRASGTNVGLVPSTVRPPGVTITWETSGSFNAGFDFQMFKSRLTGTLEFYSKNTRDLLFLMPSPESSGISSYWDNVGDMRNSGVELNLMGVVLRGKDYGINVFGNISTNSSVVLRLPEERRLPDPKTGEQTNGFSSGSHWFGQGDAVYTYYMPRYAGVNERGESMWYTRTQDTDGRWVETTTTVYGEADSYKLDKSAQPDFFGGFGVSAFWHGFDFSVSFDYQIGGWSYDGSYASFMAPPTGPSGTAIHRDVLKSWDPTNNTTSQIPMWYYGNQSAAQQSDRFLVSSSYLNLGNINVGYTFPDRVAKRLGLGNLRVYCVAENVNYWTAREGLDPRGSWSGGVPSANYSLIRTISGGVQLTF